MNKKIKAIAITALILAGTMLTGCASGGFDNSNLLRPPRTTGDKAQIQEIIEEKAGGDYTLKYPKDGSYRSAIIDKDLDGDDVNESIVFYKPSGNEEPTRILLIKNFGGTWKDIGDYPGGNTDVDKVEIGDITGNGTLDVIVGWSDKNGSVCTLSAYIVQEKTTAELKVKDTYNEFMLADMNGDKKQSIMLFSLVSESADANVKMLQYDDESKSIFTRSSVAMSNAANQYLNFRFGKATKVTSGIFVDTFGVSGESETQFIYWDKKSSNLVNPLYVQSDDKTSLNPTIRPSNEAVCTDIDENGLTDIPILTLMPHNSNEGTKLVAFQTTWNSYTPSTDTLSPLIETVTNAEKGYYFIIPDEWKGKVTARNSISGNSLTFYLWNKTSDNDSNNDSDNENETDTEYAEGSLGDKLLTIQVFSAQEWTNTKNNDYIEVGDYGDIVYTVNIPSETENTKGIAMSLNKIPNYLKLTKK
ncbi:MULTISPECIES: hypothetical protein [unclassified Ruminococcus]|uniref:hypothetical protein n=1 Tax=unclassified Ruminococcus TaxID=2608920 RepID=UPI00210E8826|nr:MULTISPECIES: hypothetical protein [unclassified Ruminococcus]MCQ4021990.1 hypothetical protein [Ruminococcus sp. zg-924]MCQ4114526.1 hypothetical protein [Ruminococcus sp. zg-921]